MYDNVNSTTVIDDTILRYQNTYINSKSTWQGKNKTIILSYSYSSTKDDKTDIWFWFCVFQMCAFAKP